jgi:DNA-binding Lrp family transcriptional regulator
MIGLSPAQRALLDRFQRDFPICPAPYAEVARALRLREEDVLAALSALVEAGIVARVGPVFRAGSIGASTLAAMAVPVARLGDVARIVGAREGVNHNYAREHRLNLWFVAHARDPAALATLLREIEHETALPAISLPLVREYHVDLGFALEGARARRRPPAAAPPARIDDGEPWRVACALERGLARVARPYAAIAREAGVDAADAEARVRGYLRAWTDAGVVKRTGLIVRHRPLGFTANVMAVWEIPERDVDRVGAHLATEPAVTLCYRRTPAPPQWRHNLFCMLHGRQRGQVDRDVDALIVRHKLAGYPHARLWSIAAYKQTGARHDGVAAHG